MLHFASFHVIFHIFYCTYHTHRTHLTHVAQFAFREQRAFHALHHTSRHFMCHFMSFHHENSLHSHSHHLALKREERGSKCQALQYSATWVGCSNQEDKNATSSRHFISRVQFRPRVSLLTKNSSCTWTNSYPRVVQALLRDLKLLEKS